MSRLRLLLPELSTLSVGAGVLALLSLTGLLEWLLAGSTTAIVLVSPGNPTGITIPPERIVEFAELAKAHDLAFIIDETYRSFRPTETAAHPLFGDPTWRDTVISLHSFSKDLAIPGYRVGAVVAGEPARLEALKILDCVAICAPPIGQIACIAGSSTPTSGDGSRRSESPPTNNASSW